MSRCRHLPFCATRPRGLRTGLTSDLEALLRMAAGAGHASHHIPHTPAPPVARELIRSQVWGAGGRAEAFGFEVDVMAGVCGEQH